MTPAAVYALARATGLDGDSAIIATALAWAESGLDPQAVGDVGLVDEQWGPSYGLWQVRSLWADKGTGKDRDADRLLDPQFNASAMVAISAGGTNWTPWTMFRNGRYAEHLDAVRAAVKGVPMRLVTRAQWGARSASTSTDITPDGVAIHWEGPHIGTFPHSSCAGLVRGIQAYHMDTNGWADIAYSAVACPHGYVFEGRGPGHRTAANGTNDGNQRFYAVCFLGGEGDVFTLQPDEAAGGLTDTISPHHSGRHSDELGDHLTDLLHEMHRKGQAEPEGLIADGSARDAIDDAIDWLGGGQIVGHRDLTETACPGDEIETWVRNGHPRAATPQPPAPPVPTPAPVPKEDDMASPYTLFNWGGAVWAWSGGDPLPLDNWAQVEPYLNQGAVTIGDLTDEQFAAIAPTYRGRHPAAEKDQTRAMAAVRPAGASDG